MNDLVDDFLEHRFRWRPVDASFAGDTRHDHLLPPVGARAVADELDEMRALLHTARLDTTAHPHDRRMIVGELEVECARQTDRPRQANPAWLTGESGFGIVSLLLPQSAPWRRQAIAARLSRLPAFLSDGRSFLADTPTPAGWVERARTEAAALALFFREDMRLHEAWQDNWDAPAAAAADAMDRFAASLTDLPDADPAAGAAHLSLVFSALHALDETPDDARARAETAFARCEEDMRRMAREIDTKTSWQSQLDAVSRIGPEHREAVLDHYRLWDTRAREAADRHGLVTPECEYGLDYRVLPECFRRIAGPLYFLFYRSPPALNPGEGSVYWVNPSADPSAHNTAFVKTVHAVHHGSVGHHTQNARARAASSRLARLAATDGAMGLALPGALTLVEGWACHVEDVLAEAEGFYTPAEQLLLKSFERRNAASVLVDINLHQGVWDQTTAEWFYAQRAGFAPSRVRSEVIRNSMFPASRATYWLGVEGIRTMRAKWSGSTRDFHDRLLSYGHVPLAFAEEAMRAAGELAA